MRRITILAGGIAALFSLACTTEDSVFEGRVQRYVLDGEGRASTHLLLQLADDESAELRFSGAAPDLVSGARLRVWGQFLPKEPLELGTRPPFAVARFHEVPSDETRAQAIVVAPERAPPPRKLLVILLNFVNDQRQPVTVDEVRRKVFTGPDSTRAFFREQSYGVVDLQGKTGPTGDVYGWYTIAGANRPCSAAAWGEAALTAARADGIDTTGYDNTVFFFPATDACPYLGLGQQPGKLTWINGVSFATFNHELGHNLGTPHAGARTCFDSRGQRATIGANDGNDGNCRDSEYGNPFDVMGAGFRHTHAYNKAQARWLSGGNVVEVDRDGVYTLLPQERPATGVQLLSVLRDQESLYFLEYRQPFGFDNFATGAPAVSGLIVVLGNRTRQLGRSMLLDMTPETTSFDDAPLAVGKTFEDRAAGVRITLLERNAEGAKVEVKLSAPGGGGATGGDGADRDGARDGGDAAGIGDGAADGARGADGGAAGGTTGAGGAKGSGGAGGAPGPAVVNPAPPPPPPVKSGCSYAGAGAPPPAPLLLAAAATLTWMRRRRRLRAQGLRSAGVVLVLALACSTKGLPPPNSQRGSEPAGTGGTSKASAGSGGAGGATADARPAEIGGADAQAGARDGGAEAPSDLASDLPLPPTPELVLPTASGEITGACTDYATAMCGRLRDCTPRRLAVDYGTEEFCRARHTRACLLELGNPSRLELPRERAGCTRELAAQSCRDFALGFARRSCQSKGGTQVAGAACSNHGVCSTNLRCKIDADVCGTCQPAIPEGGDCGWWASGCTDGTSCYDDRCLAPRKVGQPCQNTSAPCEPGLACTASGCRARMAGAGASCAEADLCDPLQDLFCNLTTKRCEALPPAVKAGERCQTYSAAGAWLTCADDATCIAASSAVTAPRTCIAKVDVGGTCDVNAGKSCKAPAVCTRGVCLIPKIVMGGAAPATTCK